MWESPQLPLPSVVAQLNEYGFSVSEEDFRKPNPRRWRDIYSLMYERLSERSVESSIQSKLKEVRLNAANPEYHEEGTAQVAFTQSLRRVLKSCGYPNFSLKDVLQPSPKTVHRIGSIFINRILHDLVMVTHFEDVQERIRKSQGQYESVLKRNQELKQRLNSDEDNHEHQKAEMQRLEDEINEKHKAQMDIQTLTEEDRRAAQNLKHKHSEIDLHKAELKQAISLKNQECEKISKKIVQSPKKFQVELNQLKKKLMDAKSQFSHTEQQLAESKTLMEHTVNKIDASGKAVKLAMEILADFERNAEIDAETDKLIERQSELQEELDTCFKQEEDLQDQMNIRQNKKHSLTSQSDIRLQSELQKTADFVNHSQKLTQKVNDVLSETTALRETETQQKSEIAKIEEKVDAERLDMQRQEKDCIQKITKLDAMKEESFARLRTIFSEKDKTDAWC